MQLQEASVTWLTQRGYTRDQAIHFISTSVARLTHLQSFTQDKALQAILSHVSNQSYSYPVTVPSVPTPPSLQMQEPKERPKLNLQKRTVSAATRDEPATTAAADSKDAKRGSDPQVPPDSPDLSDLSPVPAESATEVQESFDVGFGNVNAASPKHPDHQLLSPPGYQLLMQSRQKCLDQNQNAWTSSKKHSMPTRKQVSVASALQSAWLDERGRFKLWHEDVKFVFSVMTTPDTAQAAALQLDDVVSDVQDLTQILQEGEFRARHVSMLA